MAKSLSSIMSQIERLQKEAAAIQSGVITRIRKEIAQYGLTADQLFGALSSKAAVKKAAAKGPKRVKSPKYADGAGNTWGGMGKRPVWIHEALAAGKSLEDFLIAKPEAVALGKSKPAKTSAKPKAPAKTVAVAKKRAPKKAAAKRSARIKSTEG